MWGLREWKSCQTIFVSLSLANRLMSRNILQTSSRGLHPVFCEKNILTFVHEYRVYGVEAITLEAWGLYQKKP
jgi:hypothetical protein